MRVVRVKWDGDDPAEIVDGIRAAAPPPPGLVKRVGEIVQAVRERGDTALNELTVHLVQSVDEVLLLALLPDAKGAKARTSDRRVQPPVQ